MVKHRGRGPSLNKAKSAGQGMQAESYCGICVVCGKKSYFSRRAAKEVAKRHLPSEKLSIYRCGQFWHYGHLTDEVKQGLIPRPRPRS